MLKKIILLNICMLFLIGCNNQSNIINPQDSEQGDIDQNLSVVDENISDESLDKGWDAIAEQIALDEEEWHNDKITQRKNDLSFFFDNYVLTLTDDQKSQINCEEYYPLDTEYFMSLYPEEQELIKEYRQKCENFQK